MLHPPQSSTLASSRPPVGTDKRLVMSFEKEDWGGWLPYSRPGPKGALAMVDGADTFWTRSAAVKIVTLDLSIEPRRMVRAEV